MVSSSSCNGLSVVEIIVVEPSSINQWDDLENVWIFNQIVWRTIEGWSFPQVNDAVRILGSRLLEDNLSRHRVPPAFAQHSSPGVFLASKRHRRGQLIKAQLLLPL